VDNKVIIFGGENQARIPINSDVHILEGKEWNTVVASG